MHFCVSATRGGWGAGAWPRKMGTNWFMPALVKRRLGESGSSELEGTMVCCFSLKKSRKLLRMSEEVMTGKKESGEFDGITEFTKLTEFLRGRQGKFDRINKIYRIGKTELILPQACPTSSELQYPNSDTFVNFAIQLNSTGNVRNRSTIQLYVYLHEI